MKNRILPLAGIATLILIGSAVGGAIIAARRAEASRNAAGTMSLPAGNPVVTGTQINSTVHNNTMSDIATELTDSKSRSGKGDFTAPVRGADGSVASPTWSWTNDTGSGEYRIGSGDFGWAIAGTKKLELTSSLFTVVPNVSFSGFVSGALGVGVASPHATSPLFVLGTGTSFGVQSRSGQDTRLLSNSYFDGSNDKYNATGFAGMLQLGGLVDANFAFLTAPSGSAGATVTFTQRLLVNESGVTVGSSGTAIAQITTGTGTYNGGTPATFTATVASGAKCVASKNQTGGAAAAAVSVSSTTLTVTSSAAGDVGTANYFCF